MAQHLTGAPIVAASSHRFVWRMADSPPIHPPMKIRLRKTDVKPSRYRLFGQCSKTEQAKARKLYRQGASIQRIAHAINCYPGSVSATAEENGWKRGAK